MTVKRGYYEKGHRAEIWAAAFLMLKGYFPLARRYKTRHGEVDLVVRRGNTLVFVEVKARSGRNAGLEAVTMTGQKRIAAAAEHFRAHHPRFAMHDCRFDAVVVSPRRLPYHLKDAWRL
jgi:putative endonuclease